MNFHVRRIGKNHQEMKTDAIETGTMDKKEAVDQAKRLLRAAEELLYNADEREQSDICGFIVADLEVA